MAIEELIRIGETTNNQYIEDWKNGGGRVIGYTCSYAPEEIIQAAGLLPIRLKATGSSETNTADVYMPKFHCLFSRHLLEAGIAVAPGNFFGERGEGYVRMALVPTRELCREAAQILEKVL